MNAEIVADESVDFRIVVQLREKGLHVYSISEQLPSSKDDAVLKFAHSIGALLLTEDKDFGELVFRLQMPHAGILLIKIEDTGRKIPLVVDTVIRNYKEMLGKFSVIDGNKLRIKE
jgi:predicted nuclease of predicted toxin-antitoxin system